MIQEIKVPSPGESITEVEIANWLKKDGDYVRKDDELCEIDSDKATLTVNAEVAGTLTIKVGGGTVKVGEVICTIDTSAAAPTDAPTPAQKAEKPAAAVAPTPTPTPTPTPVQTAATASYASGTPSPAAKKLMDENKISTSQVQATGKDGRITKADVLNALSSGFAQQPNVAASLNGWQGGRNERREKMSMLRRKVAERLVSVKNQTAMLTTFNEVNMKPIMDLRAKYKQQFTETHGVNIGFMSFFTKAVTEALYHFPAVNARIDGQEVVYNDFCDIGIAVSSPKGLMVPIIRNAEGLSLAGIENEIKRLAGKARNGSISVEDMTGGTFTITNGGVFGSMMSTPIINPPQVAILGMHNVVDRPVVENGQIVIRPMMYVALSYDHRIIDGRESVSFLVKVKEMLENPSRILFGGKDPEQVLLGL